MSQNRLDLSWTILFRRLIIRDRGGQLAARGSHVAPHIVFNGQRNDSENFFIWNFF